MGAIVGQSKQVSIWYSKRLYCKGRDQAPWTIFLARPDCSARSQHSNFCGFPESNISTMFCALGEQPAYFTCGRSEERFIQLAELRVVREWMSSDDP